MPAPTATQACGYCTRPFGPEGPTTYRLAVAGDGYRWTVDDDEVATAEWRGGTWDIFDPEGGRPAMTLVPVDVDHGTRVALVDHRSRLVATLVPEHGGDGSLAVVRDGYDRLLLLVRDDGPTGVHVIDGNGNVLALASRVGDGAGVGLDLLVLDRGNKALGGIFLLGLGLVLELSRLGGLRRVA